MDTQLRFRNLADLFVQSLSRVEQADKVCLEIIRSDRQESLTFGDLAHRAARFASWLREFADVQIGSHVAIVGKNRADWDAALWGVVTAGALPVLIDPERPVDGVITHLDHTDSCGLVLADDYQDEQSRRRLRDFCEEKGLWFVEMTDTPFCDSLSGGADAGEVSVRLSEVYERVGPDNTAVILCTSGTTGDPREVELTHRNLIANIEGSVEKIDLSGSDRIGHILPPHHSFGFTVGKILPLRVGATSIYTNQYRQVADLVRDQKVTIFIAVPALYTVLAKAIEDGLAKEKKRKRHVRLLDRYLPKLVGKALIRKLGWEKLRFCLSGSAAMPKWVLDIFWRHGLLLYEGYGTTENSPVYGFNDSRKKLGSVGKPIPTLCVKIVDDELREVPPLEKGEIALGGPCIMKGYYKNPRSTDAVIRTDTNGVRWLHTGDLGYLNEEGDLFITGRKKYLIVLPGGKNVNPELVESALLEARFVAEILVVPSVRERTPGLSQEAVKAIVRPAWSEIENHANVPTRELIDKPEELKKLVWQNISECQRTSRQLSSYEKISSSNLEIHIDEFQKTSTGKVRRELYVKM